MSFVAGRAIAVAAGATIPLPAVIDVGGNAPPITLYSHMRIPIGPVSISFDTGQSYAITGDTVVPIPPGATQMTCSGAISVMVGQDH